LPLSARRQAGYSLMELLVALLVATILVAVSLPMFWRAYRSYQLTSAAHDMADILRLTRYEAIRLNKPVNCVIQASGSYPGMIVAFTDSNGNNMPDRNENMRLLGSAGNLVDPGSGVPGLSALLTASNIGSMPTQSWPTITSVLFDARGAVKPPTNVDVFYLASAVAPEAGYRAVLLMPAGSMQIWIADASGNWQELR